MAARWRTCWPPNWRGRASPWSAGWPWHPYCGVPPGAGSGRAHAGCVGSGLDELYPPQNRGRPQLSPSRGPWSAITPSARDPTPIIFLLQSHHQRVEPRGRHRGGRRAQRGARSRPGLPVNKAADVFAVPGNILHPGSAGCNALIVSRALPPCCRWTTCSNNWTSIPLAGAHQRPQHCAPPAGTATAGAALAGADAHRRDCAQRQVDAPTCWRAAHGDGTQGPVYPAHDARAGVKYNTAQKQGVEMYATILAGGAGTRSVAAAGRNSQSNSPILPAAAAL